MPDTPASRRCPVCKQSVSALSVCPHCRARLGDTLKTFRTAWVLVGGALVLLAALFLWQQKLGDTTRPTEERPWLQGKSPVIPDGGATPGVPVPVPFESETCVPWHISAAQAAAPGSVSYLVINSRVVDAGGLVLSGFAEQCGQNLRVLTLEDLPEGKLKIEVETHRPAAVVTVGLGAFSRAQKEVPDLPVLFSHVFNPLGLNLDHEMATGISPWVPVRPMMRHLLAVLPKKKTLGLIFPAGPFVKLARQAVAAAREAQRPILLFELSKSARIDQVLARAAEKTGAWIVLADRKIIDMKTFNRIQLEAEKRAIPIGVSDEEHVRRGALVGVGPDSHRLGQQLCRLAGALYRGELPTGSRVFCPEYSFAAIHIALAEKLGYLFGPAQLKQAKLYKWH